MRKNWNHYFLQIVFVCLFLLTACAGKMSYRYGNTSYETPEPAFAAQKQGIDAVLSKINPTKNPVGGSANVVLPSMAYYEKNFPVVWNGPEPSQEAKEKTNNYIATLDINGWRGVGYAIEKRRIFDNVIITQSDDPERAIFSEDFGIMLFKNKEGQTQWFVKRKKDNPENLISIEEASTALPPVQRMILRLDKIENTARGQ